MSKRARRRGAASPDVVVPVVAAPADARVESTLALRPSGLARGTPIAALALLLLVFLLLKTYLLVAADSDENIYFYMSVRAAFEGQQPYRDFFFAHPPLHLWLSIAVFELVALV